MNSERRLIRVVTGCAVMVVLLHLLFAFWRVPTGWGVHFLAFFPPWVAFGSTALALLLLLPPVSDRAVRMISGIPLREIRLPVLRYRYVRYALIGLLALIPFYLLRVQVLTLGDGPARVKQLSQAQKALYHEPLTIYLVRVLYGQLQGGGEADALWVYQVLSWTCGVLYVFISFLLSDAVGRNRRERTILRLSLLTVGTVELFFGYAETYAPLTVAILIFLYTAWRYLGGQGSLTTPVLVWAIAFAFHFSASVLSPSLAFLYYTEWRRGPSRPGFLLNLAIPPVLIASILLLIGFDLSDFFQEFGRKPHTVPLWTPDPPLRPHTLLSPIHLTDVLNQHLLVAPMGLLIIGAAFLTLRDRVAQSPHLVLLSSATLFCVLFVFLFNPEIGAFRDWDLLSPVAVPTALLAAYLLTRCAEPSTQVRLTWIVSVVSLFHLVPWLYVNADTDRSISRFAASLSDASRLSARARAWGYEELCVIHEQMGKKREALEAARAALDAQPKRPYLLSTVLRLMREVGEGAKAETLLKDIIARNPDYGNARTYLAAHYQVMGDLDRAIREWLQILKTNPDYVPGRIDLATALKEKGDLDGAIDAWRQLLRIDPKQVSARLDLAAALEKKGDLDGAISEYRQALTISPNLTETRNNLAVALMDKGDLDGAISEYRQVIKTDPAFLPARNNLGMALKEKGDLDGAIGEYRQVINADSAFAPARFNLGVALKLKGDRTGAIEALRAYIRLSTDEHWKKKARESILELGGTP
jgi:tetratricopeptide (TPR) repeat protein